jgi:protein-S-isoprenylcysteine O-methyltransferase Ste14
LTTTTLLRIATIGTLWLGTVFFLGPFVAIYVSENLGWPRWQHPSLVVLGRGLIAAGVATLLWTLWVFRVEGGGTPVPTDPPIRLVSSGLYRFSRNPVYVADVALLLGIFLAKGHLALGVYAVLVFIGLHAWVVLHEEPRLEARFGPAWSEYTGHVPRWWGRPLPRAAPAA